MVVNRVRCTALVAMAAVGVTLSAAATSAAADQAPTGPYPLGQSSAGQSPWAVAVDPTTHSAYVTNSDGNTVSVIDEPTRTVRATVAVGTKPWGIDVDPSTHEIWVANYQDGTLSVIDGNTLGAPHTITGIGTGPSAVAINPVTHTVYVTHEQDNTLTVIDELDETVRDTIDITGNDSSGGAAAVAVDPSTNTVYVPNSPAESLVVIDGSTDQVKRVIPGIGVGPFDLGVDPGVGKVYVSDYGTLGGSEPALSVVDLAGGAVRHIALSASKGWGVAVDAATHTAYAVTEGDGQMSVIDTRSDDVLGVVAAGTDPQYPAVDTSTHQIFVADYFGGVSVIQGREPSRTAVSVKPARVQAKVGKAGAGEGNPSGTVSFSVDGESLGEAQLVDGVATLDKAVPPGKTRRVRAVYVGDGLFLTSARTVLRRDPVIVARLTSAHGPTRSGWYRTAVAVRFRCAPRGAALAAPCPKPVRVTRDGRHLLHRSVSAVNGGRATARPVVRLDRTNPLVAVHRAPRTRAGARVHCSDRLSGVASCRLVRHRRGHVVAYRGIARDKAGNVARVKGSFRLA